MSYSKAYYAGGYRAMIDGVPVRLARKPSPFALALMRDKAPFLLNGEFVSYSKLVEYRQAKARAEREEAEAERRASVEAKRLERGLDVPLAAERQAA